MNLERRRTPLPFGGVRLLSFVDVGDVTFLSRHRLPTRGKRQTASFRTHDNWTPFVPVLPDAWTQAKRSRMRTRLWTRGDGVSQIAQRAGGIRTGVGQATR